MTGESNSTDEPRPVNWSATHESRGHSTPHAAPFREVQSSICANIENGELPSVAFAIARRDEIIHENAFGWADREQRIAATVDTPYPLACATKPIVATALMILHERGRVDLDAPAARYAGDWLSPEASGRPLPDMQ